MRETAATPKPDRSNAPRKRDWQIAELLADKNRLFLLWQVSQGRCQTKSDYDSKFSGPDFDAMAGELIENGFLVTADDGRLRLTPDGETVIRRWTRETKGVAPRRPVRGRRARSTQPSVEKLIKGNPSFEKLVKGNPSFEKFIKGNTSVEKLTQIKKLADEVGGMSTLKRLIEVVCK